MKKYVKTFEGFTSKEAIEGYEDKFTRNSIRNSIRFNIVIDKDKFDQQRKKFIEDKLNKLNILGGYTIDTITNYDKELEINQIVYMVKPNILEYVKNTDNYYRDDFEKIYNIEEMSEELQIKLGNIEKYDWVISLEMV